MNVSVKNQSGSITDGAANSNHTLSCHMVNRHTSESDVGFAHRNRNFPSVSVADFSDMHVACAHLLYQYIVKSSDIVSKDKLCPTSKWSVEQLQQTC